MKIDKQLLKPFIINALKEDVGEGDHTSLATIPKNKSGKARLIIKEEGIVAGVEVAREIFFHVDPKLIVEVFIKDGSAVKHGDIVLHVTGSVHSILIAERLVLNTMQRMSGIATKTDTIGKLLKDTKTKLLDTRKTTPGMRYLEKLAVAIGGGANHRFGLYDMILIKDNHVDYAGGIKPAIEATTNYLARKKLNIPVEIEVRNLDELKQVINIGNIDRILLDNFDYATLKKAVNLINGKFVTEASGGITIDNVLEYAKCGVDYISMGALTHSVKSLDMSLKAI